MSVLVGYSSMGGFPAFIYIVLVEAILDMVKNNNGALRFPG